ncbi:hypothetical protein Q8F55_002492 [Vanrija albida]|uniref:Lipocalin/cytosolic fatty-acid binding domain-containing protein n=1 Tax=Vanrija albida TaxID=181172 RepID=A0ABR3QA21_9TREE
MPDTAPEIKINLPGSSDPALADTPTGFKRQWFMGTWSVVWSTLPMWKVDVTIKYTPLSEGDYNKFESDVSYSPRKGGSVSRVVGVERLSPGTNGATFDWRGNGWLVLITSHWEVLGYGVETVDGAEVEWAVTSFSKTLFTPAGLDLYLRAKTDTPVSAEVRKAVIERVVPHVREAGADVGRLGAQGFEVP